MLLGEKMNLYPNLLLNKVEEITLIEYEVELKK